jgi:hypothetical protein
MKEKYKKFKGLTVGNKLILFEAFLFQLFTGLILKLVPFRMIPRLYSLPLNLRSQISILTSGKSYIRSVKIKQAILITSRLSPWKNKCLVQSLAARWMLNLRKIPSRLSLGVALNEDKKLIAHAWLKTGEFEIVEISGSFSELFLF